MKKEFIRMSQDNLNNYIRLGAEPKYYSADDLYNIFQDGTIEELPNDILVYNYEDINNVQDLINIVFESYEEKVEFINYLFKN